MTIAALKPLHKGLEDLFQKYRSMEFLFGLKLFLAIALGFLVSARTGLAQPQWAAITSATVLNPLSSANASKSFFRLLGTLLAGAITLLIFGACGSSVALILILIGAFIAVSAFWGTLDGTPRGYAFLLAAYTAAIIGMPALNDPSMIFDNAVNRVLEISLGIICAFVVDQILFQKSTVTALHEQISRWIDDVEDWIADVLSGTESDSVLTLRRRKVVYDAASLDQLGVHAQFDPSVPPSFKKLLQRIQNRMLMLIVSIEAVRDRMEILKKQDPGPLTDSCRAAVRDCLLWLEKRRSYQDPKELLDRLSQLELAASSAGETEGPLILSLTDRLREMIAFFTHLRRLAKFVSPRRFKIVSRLPSDETDRSVRHWNPSTAVVTSAVAVLSYAVGCCIWHVTAWPQGSTLTFMAVVAAILFGNSNRPARSIAQAAGMLFYCALLSALYLYGIYPHLHHVESLLASWALLFIPIGVISARNPVGNFFAVNVCASLGFQNTFSPLEFSQFLEINSASSLGFLIASAILSITFFFTSAWEREKILKSCETERLSIAKGDSGRTHVELVNLMLRRIALLSHQASDEDFEKKGMRILREIRSSLNLMELRRLQAQTSVELAQKIERIFASVAHSPPGELESRLDETIRGAQDVKILSALVGLKLSL